MALTENNYTSRWSLKEPAGTIYITQNDIEIFQLLCRYRYLRSHFIAALTGRGNSSLYERLRDLRRHGYLACPHLEQQKLFIGLRGNLIYENAPKAVRVLKEYGLYAHDPVAPLHPARDEHSDRFPHSLMICDILAGIDIGARLVGTRLIGQKDITENPLETPPVYISHKDVPAKALPVVPDALFGIEFNGRRTYYALEADCNTEPRQRTTFSRTSYLRKILQYRALIESNLQRDHWGIDHLNVLNITVSEEHMHDLMQTTETEVRASKSMLFAHHPYLKQRQSPKADGSLFTRPYLRVGHGPWSLNK